MLNTVPKMGVCKQQPHILCLSLCLLLLALAGCVPSTQPALAPTHTIQPAPTQAPVIAHTPTSTPVTVDVNLPLSEIAYKVPIAIRHVTRDSATLYFELDAPSAGRVFVRPAASSEPVFEKEISPSQTIYLWTLTGLAAHTHYDVIVTLGEEGKTLQQPQFMGRAWGPVSFKTTADSGVIRVGIIGDASFGDPATTALVEQMAAADLDFVLHTGDVVDETRQGEDPFESYQQKFYTPFEPLLKQMPVYTVPGNHDYDRDIRWQDEPFYYHAFPAFPDPDFPGQETREPNQYYAFARQGIQFLMLDSHVFAGASGRAEELAWLKERLADSRFVATIPVFHVAPLNSSSVHPDDSLPVRYDWLPLFEKANVPVTFSGHFHQYERLAANGVTTIISGGGSSTLYVLGTRLPESIIAKRQTHFVLMEIDGNQIKLTAIALGGDIIDQVEIPVGH